MGQGHGVLLVDVALKLGLQAGPLIVGEGQRDEGLGLTHEFVNVALPRHLERERAGLESRRIVYEKNTFSTFFSRRTKLGLIKMD